jgi:hypothetical protein
MEGIDELAAEERPVLVASDAERWHYFFGEGPL